jgi:hypothetical protein
MMELLLQMEDFAEVLSVSEVEAGYVVEIDDSEGMPLALDEILDELEEMCLEVVDEHEFGQSYRFADCEVAVVFVGDYE